jgi:hypothetical protein
MMKRLKEIAVGKYEPGDFVKVEFPDDASGIGERMRIRVTGCDDEKELVFGTLDSVPLNDHEGKLKLGTELAVAFERIVQHRKSWEFDAIN